MPVLKALGHACFTLSTDQHSIIFDPFLKGNPQAVCGPDDVVADAVLVSHGHADHLGDAIEIAKRLGCPIVAVFELCNYCERFGCQVAPMHIGGSRTFEFGNVKLTQAWHGSAVKSGETSENVGPAAGFLVTMGGKTVYFAGDTGLFGDMKLIGDEGVDLAILPIGGTYTMDPSDAAKAAELIRPKLVVPMHYGTFPQIEQDPAAFAEELERRGVGCTVLAAGEELEL